jgi:hypothetical protein
MLFGIPAQLSKARVRPSRGPRPALKPAATSALGEPLHCNSATPHFSAGARLDDLVQELLRASRANRANVFRGVQLDVTPLHGCAVAP